MSQDPNATPSGFSPPPPSLSTPPPPPPGYDPPAYEPPGGWGPPEQPPYGGGPPGEPPQGGPPGWPPGPPGPPGGPWPPEPPKRNWLLIGGVIVAVLVVLGGIATAAVLLLNKSSDKKSSTASGTSSSQTSTSSSSTSTTNTKTRTTTTKTSTSTGSSGAETRLLSLLPDGYSSGACKPITPVTDALATVDCEQNSKTGGPDVARYSLFPDQATLDDHFKSSINANEELLPCPGSTEQSPTTWHFKETPGQVEGQVACGTYKGNADVSWSRDADLLLADAQGSDLSALYQWWLQFG